MPDIEKILKDLNTLLQIVFGKNVPSWITPTTGWVLLTAFLLCGLWGLLLLMSKIKDIWTKDFLPLFYKPEQKRYQRRRQKFAEHIEYEIRRIDRQEDWKDDRFAELEAEVEAEGRRKSSFILPFSRPHDGLRRERSLSRALAYSQERFILVEGDPGSGKSVALRHVAQHLAAQAKQARNIHCIIPVYVNLKELERQADVAIDRNLIEDFILKTLRRSNDRDIDRFLDEEFAKGIEQGTWIFLFDSFDELPEVLSSTEADTIIRNYSDAIADFLEGGMNGCRGVIASRQFRGPKNFSWPRFRILSLSEKRRHELIHKVDLSPKLEQELVGSLGIASNEIRSWASNPLFLALLCEHIRSGNPFPENVHAVFETYIEDRLKRDQGRLHKRFSLVSDEIRTTAEDIAFCMAADNGLGLSPTRTNLREAMLRQGMMLHANLETQLDALEYIKLARTDTASVSSNDRTFTFAHRRFQEYFATCVVLRDPSRVSPDQLLTSGRWRETAVVMCQTQPIHILQPLLAHAEVLLTRFCNNISNLITNPLQAMLQTTQERTIDHFPWPAGSLHLLELLQDGLTGRLHEVPIALREYVGQLAFSATKTGALDDRKWALEVSGIAPGPVFSYMLQNAFAEQSQWIKDVAYKQVAHLHTIAPKIEQGMRFAIVKLARGGRLQREKYATQTHLARLPQPIANNLLSVARLLLNVPIIDLGCLALVNLCLVFCFLLYSDSLERIIISLFIITIPRIFMINRPPSGARYFLTLLQLSFGWILFFPIALYKLPHLVFAAPQKNLELYFPINTNFLLFFCLLFLYYSLLRSFIFLTIRYAERINWIFYTFLPFGFAISLVFHTLIYCYKYIFDFRAVKKRLVQAINALIKSIDTFIHSKNSKFWFTGIASTGAFIILAIIVTYNFIDKNIFHAFLILFSIFIGIFYAAIFVRFIIRIFRAFYNGEITKLLENSKSGLKRLIPELAEAVQRFLRRIREWNNWKQLRKKPVTGQNLLAIVYKFRSNTDRLEIITYTRKHHNLLPSKEAKEGLRALALKTERKYVTTNLSSTKTSEYIATSAALIDEIYLLIEDINTQLPEEDS